MRKQLNGDSSFKDFGCFLTKSVTGITYPFEVDSELLDALIDEAAGEIWVTSQHTVFEAILTELVVENGHAAIGQVL